MEISIDIVLLLIIAFIFGVLIAMNFKKNIMNLEKIIGKRTIEEILLICRLSNYMVSSKQCQYILDILKRYKEDFDIKDLELCLKIDKTIDFITLSTKDKKEINYLIE